MVELTPEILAQLERDAASFGGYFNVRIDDEFDSLDYVAIEGDRYEILTDCEIDDIAEPIARMLNAISHLVAAAKERDQLKEEVVRMRKEVEVSDMNMTAIMDGTFAVGDGTAQREIERLRAEVEKFKRAHHRLREEISEIRGALDAHGHDATFEAAMRLRDEVGRLRRFVGECLTILEAMP